MNHGRITESSQKRFIGVDLHLDSFRTCESRSNTNEKIEQKVSLTKTDLDYFIGTLDKNTWVMVESCANAFNFADMIRPNVAEVIIADSHKLKIISQTNKKTDKVDAEKISRTLKMQIISGEDVVNKVYCPEKEIQALRSLFTTYEQNKKMIISVKNHIQSLLAKNMILLPPGKLARRMIAYIESLELDQTMSFQVKIYIEQLQVLENIQTKISNQIKIAGARYYREIEILTSIKGISIMTALALIADIADIKRFPNAKHLCSYLRSAPSVESSNNTTKVKSTNKFSRKLSMCFLTQEVAHFKNSIPPLKSWYEHKTKAVKKGKIRMAACRRIIVHIYNMLIKNEYHKFRDVKNHTAKMRQYDIFLKSAGLFYENSKIA